MRVRPAACPTGGRGRQPASAGRPASATDRSARAGIFPVHLEERVERSPSVAKLVQALPDPLRPGRVIRDPFPNNIIPANRIVNPMYPLYTQFLPTPNQNPTSPNEAPTNNYLGAAEPEEIAGADGTKTAAAGESEPPVTDKKLAIKGPDDRVDVKVAMSLDAN